MATIPPVTGSQNLSSKASPADWILETQTPGPDGKAVHHNLPMASGHAHTLVVQSGVQYKLIPAVNPVKDTNTPVAPAGSVSHAKKGLDLQLMLPGGGSLVLMGFYAAHPKAAPTKLQVTQLDGKEESVISAVSKDAPATAEASVQEGDSKSSASPASSALAAPAWPPSTASTMVLAVWVSWTSALISAQQGPAMPAALSKPPPCKP